MINQGRQKLPKTGGGGQEVMQLAAAAARRRLLFWQNLGGNCRPCPPFIDALVNNQATLYSIYVCILELSGITTAIKKSSKLTWVSVELLSTPFNWFALFLIFLRQSRRISALFQGFYKEGFKTWKTSEYKSSCKFTKDLQLINFLVRKLQCIHFARENMKRKPQMDDNLANF